MVWVQNSRTVAAGDTLDAKAYRNLLMETKIKKVVLYEVSMGILMKMCWLREMENLQLLQNIRFQASVGWR